MSKWYKGDTHLHTTNSDGKYPIEKLIEKCRKIGLDYAIITDHNYNTVEKKIEETNAIKLKEIEEKVKMSKNHV